MEDVEVLQAIDRRTLSSVNELLARAEAEDGHKPLGDHLLIEMKRGRSDAFVAVMAREASGRVVSGYAQLARGNEDWILGVVVDPSARSDAMTVERDLVSAALAEISKRGAGRVYMWVPKPTHRWDDLAASEGFLPDRELLQMRRSLPVAGSRSDVDTRPFRPGFDERTWLEMNNRAFAEHPEQGGWTLETLLEREKEPWFDPAGFLLHERDGRLAAACWTKIHPGSDPQMGEIYVIAVDPDFQGYGLGLQMTLAGLESIESRAVHLAMLYVDASNGPALRMYRKLGFEVDHLDRSYTRTLDGEA